MKQSTKIINVIISFVFLFFISMSSVYALDCTINESGRYPAPLPSQMLCPFVRVFNLALVLLGAAVIIMIIIGAIKMATSLGDPKAMQGASLTWTYTVVGMLVVLLSFAFIFMLNKIFKLNIGLFKDGDPNAIFNIITEKWESFLESMFIYEGR